MIDGPSLDKIIAKLTSNRSDCPGTALVLLLDGSDEERLIVYQEGSRHAVMGMALEFLEGVKERGNVEG